MNRFILHLAIGALTLIPSASAFAEANKKRPSKQPAAARPAQQARPAQPARPAARPAQQARPAQPAARPAPAPAVRPAQQARPAQPAARPAPAPVSRSPAAGPAQGQPRVASATPALRVPVGAAPVKPGQSAPGASVSKPGSQPVKPGQSVPGTTVSKSGSYKGSSSQSTKDYTNIKYLKPTYTGKDYNKKFGYMKNGYCCYKGMHHGHWSHCCWWGGGHCRCYWDPCTSCYYYYCQPDDSWYPTDYAPYDKYSWDEPAEDRKSVV